MWVLLISPVYRREHRGSERLVKQLAESDTQLPRADLRSTPTALSTCSEQEKRKVEPLGQERWASLKTRRSETTLQCSERTPWLQTSPQFVSLKPSFFVRQRSSWKLPHRLGEPLGDQPPDLSRAPLEPHAQALGASVHLAWLPSSLCLNATHYISKSFPDHSI